MGDRPVDENAHQGLIRRPKSCRPQVTASSLSRVIAIPRLTGAWAESAPQRDFEVRSQHDHRTHMTKDTGISKRQLFMKNFAAPMVYSKEYFPPGTIINANHFEEAWNQNPSASYAETLVVGKKGERICTKRRYMIVVAQNESCYTTVPIFTHQGSGLERKQAKHEYVSIRDHTIPRQHFIPQSMHDPLVTQHLEYPVKIRMESTAWLAYPVSRQYWLPVTISGRLDVQSTKQLVDLYQELMANKLDSSHVPHRTTSIAKRRFEQDDRDSVKSVRLNNTFTPRSAVESQRQAVEALFLTNTSFANESEGRSAPRRNNSDTDDAGFYKR